MKKIYRKPVALTIDVTTEEMIAQSPIKIVSEKDKKNFISEAWNSLYPDDKYIGVERIDRARMLRISGKSSIGLEHDVVAEAIADEYEKRLYQSGFIDYESIIIESTKLLQEKTYVRECIASKYPWILIDEYQDLGRPLHEMVLSLVDNTNIRFFAVGDPDQSIYGFQGAVPDYLLELAERQDVKKIRLINNYRSNQDIIDGSELVLDQRRGYVAKTRENENATYEFIVLPEELDDQIEYFIERIIPRCKEENVPYDEIAVLVGNKSDCNRIAIECQKKSIPHYIVKHQFNRSDFVKWIENCAAWLSGYSDVGFDDIGTFWINLITINGEIYKSDSDKLLIREALFTTLNDSMVYKNSIVDWFLYLRNQLKFDSYLERNIFFQDEIDNIDNLEDEMRGEEYIDYGIDKFSHIGKPENQVVISTRHSSKGLEFEVVVMMGMEEDHFPSYYDKKDSKLLAEDNRLCFVCVSRAKRVCILMMSEYYTIPTKNGDWRKHYTPSRYWDLLRTKYGK